MTNITRPNTSTIVPPVTNATWAALALKLACEFASAGTHEEGGNNRGPEVAKFQALTGGRPGDPWCADFAVYVFTKAYALLMHLPVDIESLKRYTVAVKNRLFLPSGSCGEIEADAKKRGKFLSKDTEWGLIKPGYLVLFNWKGGLAPQHVGLVREAAEGVLKTVEGNTEATEGGNQSDGDGVELRLRSYNVVVGYVATR